VAPTTFLSLAHPEPARQKVSSAMPLTKAIVPAGDGQISVNFRPLNKENFLFARVAVSSAPPPAQRDD
jgi:hypothetical protein